MDESPNREQIRYWNEEAGQKWVRFQDLLDAQIRPLGEKAMERAEIRAGARVLDVGCGCGDTTIALARRVGPAGEVVGVDISAPMLERAATRAREAGLSQVSFVRADAQVHDFPEASFDVVFSRFGVMFFADPIAAFANLRRASKAGASLAFVCWQAVSENPWMAVPLMAALPHLPGAQLPDPDAPGPFALADANKIRRILSEAGYQQIELETVRELLSIGGSGPLEQAVDFLLQMGPTGRLLREAPPGLHERIAESVRRALEPYHTASGVRLEGTAWIVTARA